MRSCQLARTVTCGDIKHLRVPFLCSDDLWRFGSALDASVSSPRQQGVSVWPSWAVLTNEGSEMAYELRDPSSRHKRKLAHISPRFFRQPMAVHDRLPPDPRFRRKIFKKVVFGVLRDAECNWLGEVKPISLNGLRCKF